jgi:hypothetical protein
VLDVAVAEVGLQRSRIVALVGQRKATGVAQHVRMSRTHFETEARHRLHQRVENRREIDGRTADDLSKWAVAVCCCRDSRSSLSSRVFL